VQLWFEYANVQKIRGESGEERKINRYRTGWDEAAKEDWPDTAAGTLSSAASIPPDLHRPGLRTEDASWICCAASQSVNIITD
jgi:hypothetical protein